LDVADGLNVLLLLLFARWLAMKQLASIRRVYGGNGDVGFDDVEDGAIAAGVAGRGGRLFPYDERMGRVLGTAEEAALDDDERAAEGEGY
jgi:hypothetical protein